MEYCQVGRDDLGEKLLLKQVEREQANDGMFLLLAQIQQNHKQYESCLNTLDRIAIPQRHQLELFATLKAWSLFQLGRYEECKAYYEEMQPKFPESRHFIALKEAMQEKGI
jgi:tetratricopeptide (TPR) repeat protein